MKKKGFTLIELLAVIAVLAIIVLLIIPNITRIYKESKKKTFETELKEIYKSATDKWAVDSVYNNTDLVYAKTATQECERKLDFDGRKNVEYFIKINNEGNVVNLYAFDGTYQYAYKGNGLKMDQIKNSIEVSKNNNKKLTISCTVAKQTTPPPASTNDFLMANANMGGVTSPYLGTTIKKGEIEKITFTDSLEGHTVNGTDCWDVSKGQTGKVLAWATDLNNNGLYELTIGADGEVYAYNCSSQFSALENLKRIYGIEYYNTSECTSFNDMFMGCENMESLDLSYFNTSKATMMQSMFERMKTITSIDLSSFDTSNVTNMYGMFRWSDNIEYINVSNLDTSKVTNFGSMFYGAEKLKSLDVSRWNTSSATGMGNMFQDLKEVDALDVSHFDTSNVTSMGYMFDDCRKITNLNLSNFNTSKVTNMIGMFQNTNSLTSLDISNFDTTNVTNMSNMFYNSDNLRTIYVGNNFKTNNVTNHDLMFTGATKLVGGAGTVYDANHIDKTYARIDGGTSSPGYFTRK